MQKTTSTVAIDNETVDKIRKFDENMQDLNRVVHVQTMTKKLNIAEQSQLKMDAFIGEMQKMIDNL